VNFWPYRCGKTWGQINKENVSSLPTTQISGDINTNQREHVSTHLRQLISQRTSKFENIILHGK